MSRTTLIARLVTILRPIVVGALTLAVASAASAQTTTSPEAAAPAAPLPTARPAELGAAKAYDVLEAHCARCHQDGKLQDGLPGRGIANILALQEIVRDPSLIRPGVPDASRVYSSILGHDMPYDVFRGLGGTEPTPDEIQALRTWIAELPASQLGVCTGPPRLPQDAIAAAVSEAIGDLAPEQTRQLRFISLVNLYNACATPDELEAFRQAIGKLVNSLSWTAQPVRLEAIGPERLLLKLVLGDIGWIPAHWEQIVAGYPLRLAPSSRLPDPVLTATGTQIPILNGDWLADAAMRPPLYNELLGLPGRFGNLQHILRVDVDANIRRGQARRAGILQSRETRFNRIIERHPSATGALWLSYDFASNSGRQGIIEHPLGPSASDTIRVPFRHDGMKSLFHLPNGFTAFSINDVRGDRLDRSVPELDKDRLGLVRSTSSGATCLQCHTSGPIAAADEVRPAIEAERGVSKELKDAVLGLYAVEGELSALVETDAQRTRSAMQAAGIDPALKLWGLEPLRALIRAHRRPVDLARAAADFGVEIDVLRRRLNEPTGDNALTARALRQGVVRREQVNALLAEIDAPPPAADRPAAAAAAAPAGADTERLELVLASDSDAYDAGQAITVTARASHDCWLTVVNVDKSGRATVLFPNEFEPNNQITAAKERRIPGLEAPYRFRLKDRGRETLIGICSRTQKAPDGIVHDFDRLRFTALGDWNIFLREPPALDEARRDDAAQDRPRPLQRRPRAKSEPPAVKPSGPDIHARTAITVEIK